MPGRRNRRLTASEVSTFCEQITLLLNGEIPINEGLHILYQETEEKDRKSILKELETMEHESGSLYQALEKSNVFPEYMVHMVKIGETTGMIKEVMSSLAKYYERENRLKESIKNVIVYPVMLFVIQGIILLVFVLKILPMFQKVFYELDSNVSRVSEDMMTVSVLMGRSIAVAVLVIFVLIVATFAAHSTKKGKVKLRNMASRMLYIRHILYRLEIGKFVSAMLLMIRSGLENDKALALAMDVIHHKELQKKIFYCRNNIRNHMTLEASLKNSGLITGEDGTMVSVGAKAGAMDLSFERLSQKYEEETEQLFDKVSTALETILVILLSLIVGMLLISVLLPLISIISSLG